MPHNRNHPCRAHARGMRTPLIVAALAGAAAVAGALTADHSDSHRAPALHDGQVHRHDRPSDADARILGPDPATAAPVVVADRALTAMFTWRPGSASSGENFAAARPWLTGALAHDADASAAGSEIREPGPWWAWAESGDIVVATTDQAGVSVVDRRASVYITVAQQVLHRDCTATPYRRLALIAEVERTDGGWRLASYRAQ